MSDWEPIYRKAVGDNEPALNFLLAFHRYCHEIDDFIDDGVRAPDKFIALLVHANVLYTLPFFALHARELSAAVATITRAYADSLWLTASEEAWKRQMGDTLRFAGNDMVRLVAQILGGYDRAREVSGNLILVAHEHHHDEQGNPI